jgi:predicted lipid-binding transport protein (Tim44 family)
MRVVVAMLVGSILGATALAAEHPEHPKAKGQPAAAQAAPAGALDGTAFAGDRVKAGPAETSDSKEHPKK